MKGEGILCCCEIKVSGFCVCVFRGIMFFLEIRFYWDLSLSFVFCGVKGITARKCGFTKKKNSVTKFHALEKNLQNRCYQRTFLHEPIQNETVSFFKIHY